MTKITTQDVERLARLSSLELADGEAEQLTHDLERILGFVAQLDELDTSGVTPTYQVTGLANVWRQDDVNASHVTREQLLRLSAGGVVQQQVKVPKVL